MLSEQKHRYAKQKDDNIPLIREEYERRGDAANNKRDEMAERSRTVELVSFISRLKSEFMGSIVVSHNCVPRINNCVKITIV